jgi:hypothetical protein
MGERFLWGKKRVDFFCVFLEKRKKAAGTIAKPGDAGEWHYVSFGDSVRSEEVENMAESSRQRCEIEDVKRFRFRIKCDAGKFPEHT